MHTRLEMKLACILRYMYLNTTQHEQDVDPQRPGTFEECKNLSPIREQDSWLRTNVGQAISAYDIAELVNTAYGKAATIGTAENAFKAPGIWAANRNLFPGHFIAPSLAVEPQMEKDNKQDGQFCPKSVLTHYVQARFLVEN
ncbi:hypothetical protein QE152_g33737 [Popillia japonica]|uniref:Uncharacterized protein n=1 Tax=Popillia japonica TaxID=7064 RepID=A0AAW1IWC7_POPJA